MSSGCGDVLSLDDLKTAKLQQLFEAEVITGLQGGVAGGTPIDYATNQVTGQIQKTLPAVLRDAGFRPASFTFTTGGTLGVNNADLAVLWPIASGGDGAYYAWKGALPKVIPASSTPAGSGGISSSGWVQLGDITLRNNLSTATGYSYIGEVSSFSALRGITPPFSGARVKLRGWNAASIVGGGDFIGYLTAATDDGGMTAAVGAYHWKRVGTNNVLTPQMFGAVGDGSTNDTAAIQAALDYAKAQHILGKSVSVFVPAGVYMVSGITVYAFSVFYGEGRATRLKLIPGSNKSVIYGVNSDALWGYTGSAATEFVYNADIHDFLIDGNVDGVTIPFSNSLSGHGISMWGNRNRIYNIDICNCAEYGIRSEYKDQNLDYLAYFFENTMYSIRINNCGKTGWECNGPHDAAIHDVGIINASRLGNALYDGFHAGPQMSGNIGNMHVSNGEDNTGTGSTVRHRYAGNIEGPCRFYGGTTFEGSQDCVRLASSSVQFDDSCTFYIPWGDGFNGTVMWIEAGSAFCIIRGKFGGAGSFREQTNWGIRFRPGTGTVSHNDIDVLMEGIQIPISFGNSTTAVDADGGKNRVKMIAYYGGTTSSAPISFGIPNTANGTQLDMTFSGNSNSTLKSEVQNKIQSSVAAGASFTWTYKYPFQATPAINLSILSPAGTPTGNLWISAISATSATIFNGTNQTLTVVATATRQVLA